MTQEILTGKQVLALLAQDEVPEIEMLYGGGIWKTLDHAEIGIITLREGTYNYRIKPKPQRRISVTLANGEVVSWPEPVQEPLKDGQAYWFVNHNKTVCMSWWTSHAMDREYLASDTVHLTEEAAQEHADALRKINTQDAV